MSAAKSEDAPELVETAETRCCVVGGGPAGLILAYLLARHKVPVTLLESHDDFDRDFRGDTLHPSTMECLDQLGLADRLLEIPHSKLEQVAFQTPDEVVTMADLRTLNTKFPYIALMEQVKFLDFIAAEAAQFPEFDLRMGANVRKLVTEDGVCRGVQYQAADGWHEVRAPLTVACDGRFSTLRKLAGLKPVKSAPPMDVLWLRVSRRPEDSDQLNFRIREGHILVVIGREEHWQLGYIVLKGDFKSLKAEGLDAFRENLRQLAPELADRADEIQDWKQITPLNVESSRLPTWHQPGLLLIGDAAHVMSPVGGVGINYAIQDAVVAYNVLKDKLRDGNVTEQDLAAIQKQREFPIKVIQGFQAYAQKRILQQGLQAGKSFSMPWFAKLPLFSRLPARLIGFGIRRVRIDM